MLIFMDGVNARRCDGCGATEAAPEGSAVLLPDGWERGTETLPARTPDEVTLGEPAKRTAEAPRDYCAACADPDEPAQVAAPSPDGPPPMADEVTP